MYKSLVLLGILSLPALALAAGFAPQSIFLSRSPVVEGDTVRIYAIVTNPTSTTFAGTVILSENSDEIGAVAVSLNAGATQTASVLWKPLGGSHTITAKLKSNGGAVVETKSETFIVESPPSPKASEGEATNSAAAVESSAGIQQQIENVSPQAAGAAAPVFNFIDGVRQSIADVTDQQLAKTKPKLTSAPLPGSTGSPQAGQVEGTQTTAPSSTDWIWSMVYTIYFYILTLVRFIVGSAAIFYPVLALAFLYFLWRMFRHYRRPAY